MNGAPEPPIDVRRDWILYPWDDLLRVRDQGRRSLWGLQVAITLRLVYVTGQTSTVINDESTGQLRWRTKE